MLVQCGRPMLGESTGLHALYGAPSLMAPAQYGACLRGATSRKFRLPQYRTSIISKAHLVTTNFCTAPRILYVRASMRLHEQTWRNTFKHSTTLASPSGDIKSRGLSDPYPEI